MNRKYDKADVGVIIGRFQVASLHQAHLDLIQTVCDEHSKVIVVLGVSPCKTTSNNPLDFEARKQMILEKFPNVIIAFLKDINNDEIWSRKLDECVGDILGASQSAILYGSRDSFIKHYIGRFKTQELESNLFVSGTEMRNELRNKVTACPNFRHGVIWASHNRYPATIPTVDVAILNEKGQLLLARKPYELKYRFVGGFADPRSETYEQDATREVMEETQIAASTPQYIGSFLIDDWRYRSEKDKIKTLFFKVQYTYGRPTASDDICELKWFELKTIGKEDVVSEHHALLDALLANVQ